MGPNFLPLHLKTSDSESDEITLFQGPGTVGLEPTTLRLEVGLGMSLKDTHSSDEDDHVVPHLGECLLKSVELAAHGVPGLLPASKCPSRVFLPTSREITGEGRPRKRAALLLDISWDGLMGLWDYGIMASRLKTVSAAPVSQQGSPA